MTAAALIALSLISFVLSLYIAVRVFPGRNEMTLVMTGCTLVMTAGLLAASLSETQATDLHLVGGIVARGALLLLLSYRVIRWR